MIRIVLNLTEIANRLLACTFASAIVTGIISMPATTNAQAPKLITEVEGITEYRYENGVQLLLFPDQSKPQFTVNMTVLVGSRHEGYGESGMAHLLEHLLFKGTDTYPDTPKWLKDKGVLNMNGTTWYDRTNYYETLPASKENLEFAIHMEADRLINSWVRGEDLASEMTVVRNEFERGENSPQRILFQRIMTNAFQWHNYGKATIGNRSDIERVPIDRLRKFYRKYYQSDNVMVVVAGKFDKDHALELCTKYFGSLKRPKRELEKTYTEEPAQDGERLVTLRREGDVPLIGAGYHFPAAGNEDFAAAQVLSTILGMEPSGRLYKQLVEPGIASTVSTFMIKSHDPGMMIAMCDLPADADVEDVKEEFLSAIEGIAEAGIEPEDVKRAVRKLMKTREKTFADSAKFAVALSEWRAYGDWRLYFLHRDRLEAVTADDVKAAAQKYLLPANRTMGVFIPTEEPERSPLPSRPQLAKALDGYKGREAIASGESFDPSPENIDARTISGALDSGLKYAIVPKKTRGERVVMRTKMHFGDLENLKGLVPASEVLPSLLQRGTKELTFQQVKDRLDELETTLSISGGAGSMSIMLQTKREHFAAAMELLKQIVREPLLEEEQLDIVRQERVTAYESQLSEPTALGSNALYRALYPLPADDVRYFPTYEEEIERYKAISISEIKKLHAEYLNGQHVEVAIAGDVDAEVATSQLESVFGDWQESADYERFSLPVKPAASGSLQKIETPGKANSMYIAGLMLPMQEGDDQYEAALVGNYILGGGPLSSRLADTVRKEKGLSYTVRSQFTANHLDPRAMFMVYAISNPENNDEVISTIDEQIRLLLEDGPKTEELEAARDGYLKNREGSRADDSKLASILIKNLEADRTMAFYQESDQRMQSLDADAVTAALRNLIDVDRLTGFAAGDFEGDVEEKKEE
jgi:zinc protease